VCEDDSVRRLQKKICSEISLQLRGLRTSLAGALAFGKPIANLRGLVSEQLFLTTPDQESGVTIDEV
jgi:hypothetical protein